MTDLWVVFIGMIVLIISVSAYGCDNGHGLKVWVDGQPRTICLSERCAPKGK